MVNATTTMTTGGGFRPDRRNGFSRPVVRRGGTMGGRVGGGGRGRHDVGGGLWRSAGVKGGVIDSDGRRGGMIDESTRGGGGRVDHRNRRPCPRHAATPLFAIPPPPGIPAGRDAPRTRRGGGDRAVVRASPSLSLSAAARAECALSPLFNLETQHDGRSARNWMKRV